MSCHPGSFLIKLLVAKVWFSAMEMMPPLGEPPVGLPSPAGRGHFKAVWMASPCSLVTPVHGDPCLATALPGGCWGCLSSASFPIQRNLLVEPLYLPSPRRRLPAWLMRRPDLTNSPPQLRKCHLGSLLTSQCRGHSVLN